MTTKTLIIITGPTGVGKSELALSVAQTYGTPIISADSRQIYKGMSIGTDAPTEEMLQRVPHHFIATRDVTEYYSASLYEQEALRVIEEVHRERNVALLVGGSMMYIDAVSKGIDDIPDVKPEIRENLWERFELEGVEQMREELRTLDPDYLECIDPNNHKRIIHALEVCLTTGHPFSSFHTHSHKERPFKIIKIGLTRDRVELYERINSRVITMVERGLIDEARQLLPYRHFNALNTVGYKEAFAHLDGDISLEECIQKISKNTRVYARKQLSWYRRDGFIEWMHPAHIDEVMAYIDTRIKG